jgi:hypothetical protein
MKILYLSPNMEKYNAANYQREVAAELQRQCNVVCYGPGYSGYRLETPLSDLIQRYSIGSDDVIIAGHAWLSDSPDGPLEPNGKLAFDSHKGKKVLILNKEYVRLKEKLQFARRGCFTFVVSHHQDAESYTKAAGAPVLFWPFAVDARLAIRGGSPKKHDLFFSGLIKNLNHPQSQNELRRRAQREFFLTIGDLHLVRRPRYRSVKILWNAYSNIKFVTQILRLLGRYRYLSDEEYLQRMGESRAVLCTLSPANLISPRYFEAMYSGTTVLCEASDEYRLLFKPWEHFVPFNNNWSDFRECLDFACGDSAKVKAIRAAAEELVSSKHTWEHRINQLILWCKQGIPRDKYFHFLGQKCN